LAPFFEETLSPAKQLPFERGEWSRHFLQKFRTTHKFFEKETDPLLTYTIEKDEIPHTGIIKTEEIMPSSKYDHLKVFKETVAEEIHICDGCGGSILIGSTYYKEKLTNSRIGFLGERLCVQCHMK
jgi:hypothetical protein